VLTIFQILDVIIYNMFPTACTFVILVLVLLVVLVWVGVGCTSRHYC